MDKRKIKNIMALICLMGILLYGACGNEKKETPKQIYIGVACYDQRDTFLGELLETFKRECRTLEKKGYDISLTIMDAANSQRTQDDQVQEMIDNGCDILCVNLADRTDPSQIITAAQEHDIPIIFFNREPVEEDLMRWDQLYYVGAKAKQSGQMQGQLAADYIKEHPDVDRNHDGKIQYVILEGEMGHQDAIIRTESVVESLKEQGIELEKLSYQIANWNRAQAQNRMIQLIGQYKNRIEVVIANNDAMALGAMDAYEKLGYTESNWPVFFGIDGTKEGLEAVQAGTLAATVYNDKEGQATTMANLAFSVVTEDENNPNPFKNYKYIYCAYQKVTKENVQTFLEKEE